MLGLVLFATLSSTPPNKPPTLDPTYGFPIPRPHETKALAPDAQWIWAKDVSDNQTIWLRKSFKAPVHFGKAILYVAVDNTFQVSLDGGPLGQTVHSDTDGSAWDKVQSYDVSKLLTPGDHTILIKAHNENGPAGTLVRLEIDGKPKLFSDKDWEVTESASGTDGWTAATSEFHLGQGPWGSDLVGWPAPISGVPGYLFHLPIKAVAMAEVTDTTDPDHVPWQPTNGSDSFPITAGKKLLLDFGKELSGRAIVTSATAVNVKVGAGESTGEALQKPYTSAEFTAGTEEKGTPYSALRYALVTAAADAPSTTVRVHLDHLYYPVSYKGSFDCSDPTLTKIWYTGAYTAHLCMQQDIWDAPKRDRARWMGDLHVSGEVINDVFLDRFLMEQTMRRLREDAQGGHAPTDLPNMHVNGIPGYSCAWLAGMADFYRHSGDLEFLTSQKEAIVSLLEYFRGELDDNGLFANLRGQWAYVDWSVDFDKPTPQTKATTHFFLVKAVREGAYLLGELGDTALSNKYRAWADELQATGESKLKDSSGTFGDRRQENAMAVFSGVATEADRQAIYDQVLKPGTASWSKDATPYYNNYVIYALSMVGHTDDALGFIRSYWGGMLAEGATTWWEGYDNSWDKNNAHAHLQADDGTGYFVSLCHGWSAGPTSFLTDRVLGIQSTGGGFKHAAIEPHLADLDWVKGEVPTPHGNIKAFFRKSGTGITGEIVVPSGVQAELLLPGSFKLNGKAVDGKATLRTGKNTIS